MHPEERAFNRSLGATVRQLRAARNLTQHQLAVRLELRRTSITNIEKGDQGVSAYALTRLANALGVTPTELIDQTLRTTDSSAPAGVEHPPLQNWVRSLVAPTNDSTHPGAQ